MTPCSMLYVTVLCILAAFVEESSLRGYPFQIIGYARWPAVAIGATELVFAGFRGCEFGVARVATDDTLLAGILLGLWHRKTLSRAVAADGPTRRRIESEGA